MMIKLQATTDDSLEERLPKPKVLHAKREGRMEGAHEWLVERLSNPAWKIPGNL